MKLYKGASFKVSAQELKCHSSYCQHGRIICEMRGKTGVKQQILCFGMEKEVKEEKKKPNRMQVEL
jgi:hypothetical protein